MLHLVSSNHNETHYLNWQAQKSEFVTHIKAKESAGPDTNKITKIFPPPLCGQLPM